MFVRGFLFALLAIGVVAAQPQREGCSSAVQPATNRTCPATALPKRAEPIDLSISKWIWTGENATAGGNNPVGARAFRKNHTSQCGKCATCATILVAADNTYELYVNGHKVGKAANYHDAEVYYTALEPSSNLFAVEATNTGGPAALTATILIHYSDGSTETIITDETWRKYIGSPKDFHLPATDDSKWGFATFQGLNGVEPWGKISIPYALPLQNASYIWTGSINNKTGVAPVASRAFRKTVITPGCTKRAVCANVVLNVDDAFIFYVNGQKVDSVNNWKQAFAYHIPAPTLNPDVNVFAVKASNTGGGPAHFIAYIHISYDDGSSEVIMTDESWKANETVSEGFELLTLDDSSWANATNIGRWGRAPWGNLISIPKA